MGINKLRNYIQSIVIIKLNGVLKLKVFNNFSISFFFIYIILVGGVPFIVKIWNQTIF